MSTEEKMTLSERWKYLRLMKDRYDKADRKGKGALLDEMEKVTGLHRKSLIRRLNGPLTRKPRRRQRGRTYGAAVDDALRVIAKSWDYPCAERLAGNLVWMAKHLVAHGELRASPELLRQLEKISASTIRRILKRIGQDQPRLPRRRPGQTNQLIKTIPMTKISWQEQEPGHFEVDLVHHCGPSASGEYVHTLQMVDVATGWTERVAVLGRSQLVMEDAFRRILARLPFHVLEIHPDNGSEFFNHHLVRFWKETVRGVHLSRSRPFHKNDNRFVEQRNSLVRAYLGNDRLDTVAQTLVLNQLYDQMGLYFNLFQPALRLAEKTSVLTALGHFQVKRRYTQAQTPFDRLCATKAISAERKELLEHLRQQTNPGHLREAIYHTLDHLFRLPNAIPGQTEDVHLTLSTTPNLQRGGIYSVTLSLDNIHLTG